jgi:xanthine/uracil permease
VQTKELDPRQAMHVLILSSVLGFGITVVAIGWAVTAESRLDRFFAFSLLACGVVTLLPTLIARGIRLANMMRPGP